MTNAINLAALGFGGMDTSTLVTNLVGIESQPLNLLGNQQQNIQSAQATISSYSSTLSALKSAATALSDPTGFSSMKATSSDATIATTTGAAAVPGQWTVSVSSIAQEQRTLSNGVASSTSALGLSGNLGLHVGGTSGSIAIASTDTLSDVAGKIASSGLRAQASLVFDGSQYHLLVSGLDTGASNAISFDESGLAGTGYSMGLSAPSSIVQCAQDAHLTIGGSGGGAGIPITSASNQISGAIPGVTFAVTRPTTSPATVSIASDSTSILQNVQTFVTAYNATVNDGHSAAGFGTQKASNALLQGDHAIRSTLDQFGSLMSRSVPGTSGAYTTLASIGLALNDDGTLKLDSTKLTSALAADPASVSRLFVTDAHNGSQGVMAAFGTAIDAATSSAGGTIQSEIAAFTSRNKSLGDQMTAMQTRITAYQAQLTSQFTRMNATLVQYRQIASSLNASNNSKLEQRQQRPVRAPPMNLPTQAALARYGAVKVTTASPGQVLVMLYDGLLRFLREGEAAIVAKDRGQAGERIGRALAILECLLSGLDPTHSPDLCEKLEGLYVFCMQHLVRANLEQSAEKVAETLKMLVPLRDAWSTAVAELAAAPKKAASG